MALFRKERPPRRGRRPGTEKLELDTFKAEVESICQETVYPHVFKNKDREVGGVLIGWKTSVSRYPRINGAIEALRADEQRATLTFTQETWEHVHRVKDRDYPDDEIVGWYHSHPGFGIFLSEHDKFIHQNFFGDRSQVALVVDPLAGTEGVFAWQDDSVEPLYERRVSPGWAIDSLSELADEGTVHRQVANSRANRKSLPLMPMLVVLIIGVLGGFLFWNVVSGSDEPVTPANSPGKSATGPAGNQDSSESGGEPGSSVAIETGES